jgi:hypothetical protein
MLAVLRIDLPKPSRWCRTRLAQQYGQERSQLPSGRTTDPGLQSARGVGGRRGGLEEICVVTVRTSKLERGEDRER